MSNYVRYPLVLGIVCAIAGLGLAVTFNFTIGEIEHKQQIKRSAAVVTAFFNVQPVETSWSNYREFDLKTREPVERPEQGRQTYLAAYNDEAHKDILGYAAEGTFQGYSSKVVAFVGAQPVPNSSPPQYKILGVRIISQNETPGLGAQCNQVFSDETIWSKIGSLFASEDKAAGPEPGAELKAALGEDVVLLPRAAFESQFTGKTVTVADGAASGLKLDKAAWNQVKSGKPADDIAAMTGATITSNAALEAVLQAILKIDSVVTPPKP